MLRHKSSPLEPFLALFSELIAYSCCLSGRPQPDVSWFMNGKLVDDEYEHNSGNIIENRLLWPSLQRTDLYSVFTCRAANTKAVAPREKRLVLDMYRKCRVILAKKIQKVIALLFFCFACIPGHLMTLHNIIIVLSSFTFLMFFPLTPH